MLLFLSQKVPQKTSQIKGYTAYAAPAPTEFDGLCFFDPKNLQQFS